LVIWFNLVFFFLGGKIQICCRFIKRASTYCAGSSTCQFHLQTYSLLHRTT
jgi:hypothetical protein